MEEKKPIPIVKSISEVKEINPAFADQGIPFANPRIPEYVPTVKIKHGKKRRQQLFKK